MFGRGSLFVAVLIAAFAVPYFLSERPNLSGDSAYANWSSTQSSTENSRNSVQRWWDSMWTDSIDAPRRGVPTATASPLPGAGNGFQQSYRPSLGRAYPGQSAQPAQKYPRGGTVPNFPAYRRPNATATPWVPLDSQAPMGTTSFTSRPGAIPGAVAGPWVPVPGGVLAGFPQNGAGTAAPVNLVQYLGFDVTPNWVMQNWERVSTEVWRDNLEGMRVAFFSGTRADDLAGSLTYYFDREQVLQRIAFQGATGSESHVQQLAGELGLQARPSYGGSTLIRETEEGIVTDLVRIRPISGRARSPFHRFAVELELNRPGSGQSVSEPLLQKLRSASSLPSLETRSLTEALRQQAEVHGASPYPQMGIPAPSPIQGSLAPSSAIQEAIVPAQ